MIVEQTVYRFKCKRCGKLSPWYWNTQVLIEYEYEWLKGEETYCPRCMSDVNREEEVKELEENE